MTLDMARKIAALIMFTGCSMNEFVDYVLDFYGVAGIYPMGVTRDDVLLATGMRMGHCLTIGVPYEGDSIDREAVREILIERFGYKWPEAA